MIAATSVMAAWKTKIVSLPPSDTFLSPYKPTRRHVCKKKSKSYSGIWRDEEKRN
jgi:hypothetical protein